jgi:hypothetical protein
MEANTSAEVEEEGGFDLTKYALPRVLLCYHRQS